MSLMPHTSELPMKQAEGDMLNGTQKNHQGIPTFQAVGPLTQKTSVNIFPIQAADRPSRTEHTRKHSNTIFPKYHTKRLPHTELFKSPVYFLRFLEDNNSWIYTIISKLPTLPSKLCMPPCLPFGTSSGKNHI